MALAVSPLPGWAVIHPKMPQHLRPVAEGGHTGPAVFTRVADGPQAWPPPAVPEAAEVVWATTVRVEPLQRSGNSVFAEQPTITQEYQVSAPLGGPRILVGERGDIITAAGRTLRVLREEYGDLLLERVFVCVDNATQQNPQEAPNGNG